VRDVQRHPERGLIHIDLRRIVWTKLAWKSTFT
jgi:hypothetical protein